MSVSIEKGVLDRNRRRNVWVGGVVFELEVLKPKREEVADFRVQVHLWESSRSSTQLSICLVSMVEI